MTQAWIIRAGRDDEYEQIAFANNLVAVGWGRVGDLTGYRSQSAIRNHVKSTYPEMSVATQDAHAVQLYALRSVIQVDDLVVLLRGSAPDVAIGVVTGGYAYRVDLPAPHVRPVRWLRREVRRSEIDAVVLDPPALSVVYRIGKSGAVAHLRSAAGQDPSPVDPPMPGPSATPFTADLETLTPGTSTAYANLSRNLTYARNLASAGSHLEELQVTLFEVTDVYRAAWVQAVAALDHWVHQEIYDRMARLSEMSDTTKTDSYRRFVLPLGTFEDVQAGKVTLRAALAEELRTKLGFETYQNPEKIRSGFGHVADVANLWERVARVLSEQAGIRGLHTGTSVQQQIRDIVHRRNKIAHEYDEDPANAPAKNAIAATDTMRTIGWIDQIAAAILVVIDQDETDRQ